MGVPGPVRPTHHRPEPAEPFAPGAAGYLETGRLANLDQVASATESTVVGGPAHGCRALDLRVAGGIDLRLLPDRGFDIGAAWFRGVPLAWISEVGETGPLEAPSGMEWMEAFGGGLITTCGLRNVGAPSEGHGLHGRYSHLRASEVHVDRVLEGGEVVLDARATIDEVDAPGLHLRVKRRIRTRTGAGRVELTDVTTNRGAVTDVAPLLYHVNVGVPLLDGARIEIDSVETKPRDADAQEGLDRWMTAWPPERGAAEMVFEHRVRADDAGWAQAAVANPSLGLALVLRWRQAELPRFHQWVYPRWGSYALGLEPANCSVQGRAADRQAGRLPVLEPGERRTTELRVLLLEG